VVGSGFRSLSPNYPPQKAGRLGNIAAVVIWVSVHAADQSGRRTVYRPKD
jgi:hypothetical protein